jgi:catechol 2,3-dioxygenase-like lactoylglutathione lyase family enzyme
MDTSIMNSTGVWPVLAASDFRRAVAFYRDVLGFRVEESADMPGSALVYTGGDGVFLIYESDFQRGETTAMYVLVDDPETVRDNLRSQDVPIEEYDLPDLKTTDGLTEYAGIKSGWFKDSEGNMIGFGQVPAEASRKAA